LTRTVDREVSKDGGGQAMRRVLAHQVLAGELAGAIWINRLRRARFAQWLIGVAVDGCARGIDEALDWQRVHDLEQLLSDEDIALHVARETSFPRRAGATFGGKMHDHGRAVKEPHDVSAREVRLHKFELGIL